MCYNAARNSMENNNLRLRYGLALGFGVVALVALIFLVRHADFRPRFVAPSPPPVIVSTGVVKAGDTVATLFNKQPIPSAMVSKIQATFGRIFDLRRLQPNDTFDIT